MLAFANENSTQSSAKNALQSSLSVIEITNKKYFSI